MFVKHGFSFIDEGGNICISIVAKPLMKYTPQPLYNNIVGIQANFRFSYPIRVITRVKCIVVYQNQSQMTILGPAMIRVISKTVL